MLDIELLATPTAEPPRDRWTIVEIKDGEKVVDTFSVPFDAEEFTAYKEGQAANDRLVEHGGHSYGAEREYWIQGGQFYPQEYDLQDRQTARAFISIVSKRAGEILSEYPIREESIVDFTMISTLPSRFTAYDPQ